MKLKKIVQVMALSSTLAFSIPTQQAQASAAIASGGTTITLFNAALAGISGFVTIPICIEIPRRITKNIAKVCGCDEPISEALAILAGSIGFVGSAVLWAFSFALALDETPENAQLTLLDEDDPALEGMDEAQFEACNQALSRLKPSYDALQVNLSESFHKNRDKIEKKDTDDLAAQARAIASEFASKVSAKEVDLDLLAETLKDTHPINYAHIEIIKSLMTKHQDQAYTPVAAY